MRSAPSLIQALAGLGAGQVIVRRSDATLIAAILRLPAGREVVLLERTYRFGVRLIADPLPAEVELVAVGDLRELWLSSRAERVNFVV